MHGDGRATRHDATCLGDLDHELVGTCAFVAAYLRGVPADCLWEHERDRGFGVFGMAVREPRIWDALRHSFVYVDAHEGGWRLYDFASARHVRVRRVGDELLFTDEVASTWSVRVRVHEPFVFASGPDGERHYRTRRESSALYFLPVKLEALPDPLVRDSPLPLIAL
jgi:hypothetical protein